MNTGNQSFVFQMGTQIACLISAKMGVQPLTDQGRVTHTHTYIYNQIAPYLLQIMAYRIFHIKSLSEPLQVYCCLMLGQTYVKLKS